MQLRPEDAGLNLGQEQGHPATLRRQGVAELAADRLDETLTLESAQIVAHLAGGVLGVWDSEQLAHERAESSVSDAFRREHEEAERSEERGYTRIPEPEGRSRLTLRGSARGSQCTQLGLAEPTVVRRTFQVEQPPIDAPSQVRRWAKLLRALPMRKSCVLLKVVSVRRARPLLKYCLM